MASFEEIGEGQLPSDEWYSSECAHYFPHLDPNSLVGKTALDLTQDFAAADWELEERRELVRNGLPFAEGEFEELDANWWLARERWDVLLGIYNQIKYGLLFPDEPEISYENIIGQACQTMLERIRTNHYHPWRRKENLFKLANEVSAQFRAEEGFHFSDIETESTV